jgi:hypothetical protein
MSIRRKQGVCSGLASVAMGLTLCFGAAMGAELLQAAAPGDTITTRKSNVMAGGAE